MSKYLSLTTDIITINEHDNRQVSDLYLRYVHTPKGENLRSSSDWSKLSFLLSNEINVV